MGEHRQVIVDGALKPWCICGDPGCIRPWLPKKNETEGGDTDE